MKKTVGVVIAIGASLALCGPAFAGETTGQGKPTPGGDKASSACSFSGQDRPDADENQPPQFNDDFISSRGSKDVRVQSYGSFVRAGLKAAVPSPGEACRGGAEG